jgi:MFS family permease
MATVSLPLGKASDIRTTWLVSFGHFFAHLNILVLPPLFPILRDAYGVGYAELGVALAVLNITTLVTQAPVGALVDRVGAGPILIAGHMLFALAIALTGVFPTYPMLLVLMVVAGIGNSVYHPADYSILSAVVPRERTGRAFGIHTFGGYLGSAAAPILTVGLSELFGWRWALGLIGGVGVAMGFVLVLNRHLLRSPAHATPLPGSTAIGGLGLFMTLPIVMSLAFFCLLAMAQAGFSSFSSPSLIDLQGFTLVQASIPLTAFLAATAAGVLLGGWAADRTERHELVVALCFLATALLAGLLAFARFPLEPTTVLFALAGIAGGFVSPSRDMLVKKVTPAGASGRVFGFVTIGFNIGGFVAPPMFGHVIDIGHPDWVFWLVAILSLLTLVTVLFTASAGRAHLAKA